MKSVLEKNYQTIRTALIIDKDIVHNRLLSQLLLENNLVDSSKVFEDGWEALNFIRTTETLNSRLLIFVDPETEVAMGLDIKTAVKSIQFAQKENLLWILLAGNNEANSFFKAIPIKPVTLASLKSVISNCLGKDLDAGA